MPAITTSSTPVQFRLNYKSSNVRALKLRVFLSVRSFLFSYFACGPSSDSLQLLFLKTREVFEIDQIEIDTILHADSVPSKKFLDLARLIENLDRNTAGTIKLFLDLLLNLDRLEQLSRSIKNHLTSTFGNLIEVETILIPEPVTVPVPQTDQPHYPTTPSAAESQPCLGGNHARYFPNRGRKRIFHPCLLVILLFTVIMLAVYYKEIGLFLNILTLVNAQKVDHVSTQNDVTTVEYVPNDSAPPAVTDDPSAIAPQIFPNNSVQPSSKGGESPDFNISMFSVPSNQPPPSPENTTKPAKVSHRIILKYKVAATSFLDLNDAMRHIPNGTSEVHVSISLKTPSDWPSQNHVILGNSTEITQLYIDGPFLVDNLFDIFSQSPNNRHLHLNNSGNQLCSRNEGKHQLIRNIQSKVHFPLLNTLVIEGFITCPEIYEALGTYISPLRQVKRLVFFRSLIDDRNHVFIQQLLGVAGDHLQELHLKETAININTPLFGVGRRRLLKNVKKVKLDSISTNGTELPISIGKHFPQMFPSLETIYSEHGYLPWFNVHNIFQCKKLKKLRIGIEVPTERTSFNVSFLPMHFPALEACYLTLHFKSCDVLLHDVGVVSRKKEILGWEAVTNVQSVVIRSNCPLRANFEETPGIHRLNREEKYHKDRSGNFLFTYKLIKQ